MFLSVIHLIRGRLIRGLSQFPPQFDQLSAYLTPDLRRLCSCRRLPARLLLLTREGDHVQARQVFGDVSKPVQTGRWTVKKTLASSGARPSKNLHRLPHHGLKSSEIGSTVPWCWLVLARRRLLRSFVGSSPSVGSEHSVAPIRGRDSRSSSFDWPDSLWGSMHRMTSAPLPEEKINLARPCATHRPRFFFQHARGACRSHPFLALDQGLIVPWLRPSGGWRAAQPRFGGQQLPTFGLSRLLASSRRPANRCRCGGLALAMRLLPPRPMPNVPHPPHPQPRQTRTTHTTGAPEAFMTRWPAG